MTLNKGSRGFFLSLSALLCLLACLPQHAAAFTMPSCTRIPMGMGVRSMTSPRRLRQGNPLGLRMQTASVLNMMEASAGEYTEGIAKIKAANPELLEHLDTLRQQRFFRYYAVDLLSSCTYFPTIELPCEMERCDVENADDVPDDIRSRDTTEHDFRLDGWVRWDMPGDFTDYYDLVHTKERYTQYQGQRVWKFIHENIAFQKRLEDPENAWKLDYNRALSGLHTSISAHILDSMDLDPEEKLAEYKRRIADVPGAVTNLYFVYMLMLVAIQEAEPRLKTCSYMGTADFVRPSMNAIIDHPVVTDASVQQVAQKMREHATSQKAKIWKARLRTRDLLGIMNCVQCNVCRLHGKVASLGLGVGFQILLGSSLDEEIIATAGTTKAITFEKLHRVEVAALITTTAKFATAVDIISKYEAMVQKK